MCALMGIAVGDVEGPLVGNADRDAVVLVGFSVRDVVGLPVGIAEGFSSWYYRRR
jgi:hypothetical protein